MPSCSMARLKKGRFDVFWLPNEFIPKKFTSSFLLFILYSIYSNIDDIRTYCDFEHSYFFFFSIYIEVYIEDTHFLSIWILIALKKSYFNCFDT